VTVARNGASASIEAPVLAAQPGIFVNGDSTAIAATTDFRLVTAASPTARG
jgi:uncharacterized protein (TIGR03437 family)